MTNFGTAPDMRPAPARLDANFLMLARQLGVRRMDLTPDAVKTLCANMRGLYKPEYVPEKVDTLMRGRLFDLEINEFVAA